MSRRYAGAVLSLAVFLVSAEYATAQSFRVQCPTSTITHPSTLNNNNAEPTYSGPTSLAVNGSGYMVPTANVNGAIKCQQVSGGDGYSTMANGVQTFTFSFGPLSGLADIANGQPGTEFPNVFNTVYPGTLKPGDPAMSDGATSGASPGTPPLFTFNGAAGLMPDLDA